MMGKSLSIRSPEDFQDLRVIDFRISLFQYFEQVQPMKGNQRVVVNNNLIHISRSSDWDQLISTLNQFNSHTVGGISCIIDPFCNFSGKL